MRKLADGNCWMTENLRLVFAGNYVGEYNSSTNTITATTTQITPANSDVTSTWLPGHTTQLSEGEDWQSGDSDQARIDTPHSYYSPLPLTTYDGDSQTAGALYNYYTATTSSGTYATTGYAKARDSICAKGWKLPTTNHPSDASFYDLFVLTYGITTKRGTQNSSEPLDKTSSFPFSIIYPGTVHNSRLNSVGNLVVLHSSIAYNNLFSHTFLMRKNNLYYEWLNGLDKTQGNSIRCVAK